MYLCFKILATNLKSLSRKKVCIKTLIVCETAHGIESSAFLGIIILLTFINLISEQEFLGLICISFVTSFIEFLKCAY